MGVIASADTTLESHMRRKKHKEKKREGKGKERKGKER